MKKKLLSTATKTLASLLLLGVTPVAQASLEYESLSGGSVIYDTVTKTTWTQDGNLSGDSFTRQAAQNWAATLNYAGFQHWALPNTTQFTSLFTQLYPYGAPGLESNKYGASVAFGPGANDHVSPVGSFQGSFHTSQ